jgi:hypothetical protein
LTEKEKEAAAELAKQIFATLQAMPKPPRVPRDLVVFACDEDDLEAIVGPTRRTPPKRPLAPVLGDAPHVRWPNAQPYVITLALDHARGIAGDQPEESAGFTRCGEIWAIRSSAAACLASLSAPRIRAIAKRLVQHVDEDFRLAREQLPALCALASHADDEGLGLYVWSSAANALW